MGGEELGGVERGKMVVRMYYRREESIFDQTPTIHGKTNNINFRNIYREEEWNEPFKVI